jgi:diphosphomevalonate decarboxylase
MSKEKLVAHILKNQSLRPLNAEGEAFAPINIALAKYWGKRDLVLNLPVTASLSITLPQKGSHTRIALSEEPQDRVSLNGQTLPAQHQFSQKITDFLNLFRFEKSYYYQIDTQSNIPIAAGLASSASGFAALVQALNALYGWQLSKTDLSILSRLGSGSACRSLWSGFVEWQCGSDILGLDSYGHPLNQPWPALR